jgi:hypothetical protein
MRTECPDLDLGMPDGSVGHIHAHSFGCTECLAIEIERLGSTFHMEARCDAAIPLRYRLDSAHADPLDMSSYRSELRTIEIGDEEVVMYFDNSGDRTVRTIHMGAEHPADIQPSLQGHSIGWWEGSTS